MSELSIFFTASRGPIEWLIRRVTGGEFSHCGIKIDDEYYEAHAFGESKGFRGPKPWVKLSSWARLPGNRLEVVYLPEVDYAGVETVRAWCHEEANKRKRGYSLGNLLQIWACVRFLGRLGFVPKSDPSRLICSESAVRALRQVGIELTSEEYPTADSIDPNEAYRALMLWKNVGHG